MAPSRRVSRFVALVAIILAFALAAPAGALAVAPGKNGWYWPTGHEVRVPAFGWLDYRVGRYTLGPAWHLAWDDCSPSGVKNEPCYALGWGIVKVSRMDVSGYGPGGTKGGAMVVQYRTSDGTYFKALYGHVNIDLRKYPVGTKVRPGEIICTLNAYNPPHVHFGLRPGTDEPVELPWTKFKGQHTVSMLMGHTFDTTRTASGAVIPETYGFVDPALFMSTRRPWVAPPASVSTPTVPASVQSQRAFRASGSFSPKAPDGSRNIVLECERLENGKWVRRASWLGVNHDASTDSSRYQVSARLPGRGSWRVRAFAAGDMGWSSAASGWALITAR